MSNYFFDMIPKEEKERLNYLPTIPQLLEKIKNDYSESPAISNLATTITYSELYQRVGCRRTFINKQGLTPGAKIAVFDRNSMEAIELFLAITSAGYVAIMLPNALNEQQLIGSMKRFDVEMLFVRDEFKPKTENIEGVKIFSTKETDTTFTPSADVQKTTVAAIFFTGGTTGAPKGAILNHGALMRGSFNGCFRPGSVIGGHRFIALLPFSHVFGLIFSMMSVLYTGNELFTAEDMKTTIGQLPIIKPTCLVVVPGLAEILYGLTKVHGVQFLGGNLKTIVSGAANVPPRLIGEFTKLGINLVFGYGLTETANLVSGNAEAVERPTSVGKIYSEQEHKVVDGELWVKGDCLFDGYYKDEENTKAAFVDGWFRTGDLVKFDEDGYLYIVGRIKNLIILKNGENVSPEALEEPFYKNPCIQDCLVTEKTINDENVIAIEILPRMQAFQGKEWSEVVDYMQKVVDEVNATQPPFYRIAHVTVRKEDFKRTGSMKIARNQN